MQSAMILPCGVSSAANRGRRRDLHDVGGQEPIQKGSRGIAGDLDDTTVGRSAAFMRS